MLMGDVSHLKVLQGDDESYKHLFVYRRLHLHPFTASHDTYISGSYSTCLGDCCGKLPNSLTVQHAAVEILFVNSMRAVWK